MTYAEWAKHHKRLFAMGDDAAETLIEWCNLFEDERITPDELWAASRRLAKAEPPPKYRSDHLTGLQRCVRENRRDTIASTRPDDPRGTCCLCSGCGIVAVPGAGVLTAGGNMIPLDSEATVSVLCSCALGNWIGGNYKGNYPMMRLEEYAKRFPDWKREMGRLLSLPIKRARALEKAQAADGKMAGAFDTVLNRLKLKFVREPGAEG